MIMHHTTSFDLASQVKDGLAEQRRSLDQLQEALLESAMEVQALMAHAMQHSDVCVCMTGIACITPESHACPYACTSALII